VPGDMELIAAQRAQLTIPGQHGQRHAAAATGSAPSAGHRPHSRCSLWRGWGRHFNPRQEIKQRCASRLTRPAFISARATKSPTPTVRLSIPRLQRAYSDLYQCFEATTTPMRWNFEAFDERVDRRR
jgi:hypothetical protein